MDPVSNPKVTLQYSWYLLLPFWEHRQTHLCRLLAWEASGCYYVGWLAIAFKNRKSVQFEDQLGIFYLQ